MLLGVSIIADLVILYDKRQLVVDQNICCINTEEVIRGDRRAFTDYAIRL